MATKDSVNNAADKAASDAKGSSVDPFARAVAFVASAGTSELFTKGATYDPPSDPVDAAAYNSAYAEQLKK